MQTLIVGFGRAGHGLHWSVLKRLRRTEAGAALMSAQPPVVYDFDPDTPHLADDDVTSVPDLARAAELLDPKDTVVHLCTPPVARLELLEQLADLGFTRFLVEKPLAVAQSDLPAIDALRRGRGLRMTVVAHWLHSALTQRLRKVIAEGELGTLETVFIAQRKPRVTRTLATKGHPTAFDVELPHSIGLVLSLAGEGEAVGAELHDMHVEEAVVPEMGAARLLMSHHNGAQTEIFTDLASPIRERVIRLGFSEGWAVGHFPISESDDYAHLATSADDGADTVFRDDSLARFLLHAYEEFATGADLEPDFQLNMRVTSVIAEAKQYARLARLQAEESTAKTPTKDLPEVAPHA